VVELATYGGYSKLDEKLRVIGFNNDVASRVTCRYIIKGIKVNIMPTNPDGIVFSNQGYPESFATSISYDLDKETKIKIFSLPYFVAIK
jgi:hypothetical protein